MLKNLRSLLLILALSLLLVACEQAAPAADTGGESDAATEEMAMEESVCNVAAPAEAIELNLIGWPFEIMDFYTEEIEKCGDVENITINSQMQDFSATKDAFRLAMSGGGESPYDMMHMANTGITEFGSVGWLLPLNDLVDKYRDEYDLDDISATAWAGGTIDGTIYGIPAVGNTLHLAYRSDIFEEAGLEAPETYDDVIAICEALADHPDLDVVFTQDMSAGWAWELEFLHFVRAHGGDYLNEDSTPAFNSDAGVAALTQMKSIVDACMGPQGLALGYEAAEVAINTGAQAMVHIWASNTVSMIDPEQSDFSDMIAFAPAPRAVEGGPRVGSAWNDFYTIPATTPNDPDLIFQILMEALDKESMEGAADVGIVTRTSISKGLPNLPAASETLASGIGAYSTNPATSLVQAALGNHLPFVGTGELTPEEALAAAEEEYIAEATAQGYLE